MYYSPRSNLPDTYSLSAPGFDGISPFAKTATIHSTSTRQKLYRDKGTFGKLQNAFIRPDTSIPNKTVEFERKALITQTQQWKKNVEVNINDLFSEKDLLSYIGTIQSNKSQAPSTKHGKPHYFSTIRAKTSASQHRLGRNSHYGKSFGAFQSSTDVSRRDLLCSTAVEGNVQEFVDYALEDKYQKVSFVTAPPKEFLKLLRLSDYDVTLIPNDARRVLIETIMRDYFLNLVPEYSDFLICKNAQSGIYTILFTGRLVPTCKACSSVVKFELSRDLGFQVLCASPYCTDRGLYRNSLSNYTISNLWPTKPKPDNEVSVRPDDLRKAPVISKLVQSGRFKRADFVKVLSNRSLEPSEPILSRPNTTQNILRKSSLASKLDVNSIFKSTVSTRNSVQNTRPNTVQGIRVQTVKSRPGTTNSSRVEDFKGMPVLKEIEEKGLFAKKVLVKDAIEENAWDEDQENITEGRKKRREEEGNRKPNTAPFNIRRIAGKERPNRNESYSLVGAKKPKEEKEEVIEHKGDNSFDELQDIVTMMSYKGK